MTGFTFKVPERFKDYTGQYHGADKGETDFNSNVFYTNLIYLPRTDEERAAILAYRDVLSGVTLKGARRAFEVTPVGTKLSFETTDVYGNAVSSADLFAGHKVTMINLWATWCQPCRNEMPELEALNKEFAEKDCQIIGICTDLNDDTAQQATRILEEKGVTYINVKQTDELAKTLLTISMPTTYFVDSEGRVLTTPVKGANFDKYREKLEEALKTVE